MRFCFRVINCLGSLLPFSFGACHWPSLAHCGLFLLFHIPELSHTRDTAFVCREAGLRASLAPRGTLAFLPAAEVPRVHVATRSLLNLNPRCLCSGGLLIGGVRGEINSATVHKGHRRHTLSWLHTLAPEGTYASQGSLQHLFRTCWPQPGPQHTYSPPGAAPRTPSEGHSLARIQGLSEVRQSAERGGVPRTWGSACR